MKLIITTIVLFSFLISPGATALNDVSINEVASESSMVAAKSSRAKRRAKRNARKRKLKQRRARSKRSRGRRAQKRPKLIGALKLAKQGKYEKASIQLFQLSLDPYYKDKRTQIKYILGLMLYQMKFNQVSAFQFINIVKQGNSKYLRQSLEKLSLAADYLGDDTLLNYAISKVKVNQFPKAHRSMLYFRIGEYQYNNDNVLESISSFKKVAPGSRHYPNAKYMQGLAYAQLKKNKLALKTFNLLYNVRAEQGFTDAPRVAALMGKARTLYQMKKWNRSIEAYREVPRDTKFWHDTLFESSWAMLRTGRFRSALSNFHTIHSTYYEDVYQPESLLLRGIIYLYICKYDEMQKVLNLFEKIYKPVHKKTLNVLDTYKDSAHLYKYMAQVSAIDLGIKKESDFRWKLPYVVARKVFGEGDVRRNHQYIVKLQKEIRNIKKRPSFWRKSSIGKYSKRIIQTRLEKAKAKAGRLVLNHLINIKSELFSLFEQQDFIRFEMLKGKKQAVKKEVAGKGLGDLQVNEKSERDYYVQNGYEYWPFNGEYWLDELGNYHYVGVQSCQ